eukprot:899789-Rhodomonas_salina.5
MLTHLPLKCMLTPETMLSGSPTQGPETGWFRGETKTRRCKGSSGSVQVQNVLPSLSLSPFLHPSLPLPTHFLSPSIPFFSSAPFCFPPPAVFYRYLPACAVKRTGANTA